MLGIIKFKKGDEILKKDFFNGKIKREFVSYIRYKIIIAAVMFFGMGGFFLYFYFLANLSRETRILVLVFAVTLFLFGIFRSFGTVFIIRKYPKYKKITKLFLNSECYFVDSDSKEFYGRPEERVLFDAFTQLAEQSEYPENIKYPKKYRVFICLTIIGVILEFVYIAVAYIALENVELLPKVLQNEYIVFAIFMIIEMLNTVFSFVFAFRIKKIRKETIEEYRNTKR